MSYITRHPPLTRVTPLPIAKVLYEVAPDRFRGTIHLLVAEQLEKQCSQGQGQGQGRVAEKQPLGPGLEQKQVRERREGARLSS